MTGVTTYTLKRQDTKKGKDFVETSSRQSSEVCLVFFSNKVIWSEDDFKECEVHFACLEILEQDGVFQGPTVLVLVLVLVYFVWIKSFTILSGIRNTVIKNI